MLFRGQQSFSTLPPKNPYRRDDFTFDTPPGDSNFNPVKLAYRALEYRGEEKDKAKKSPLIVHHSLYGRKENWNPISDVSFFLHKTLDFYPPSDRNDEAKGNFKRKLNLGVNFASLSKFSLLRKT